jgi:hypothetical protein
MALTRAQRRLQKTAEQIAVSVKVDVSSVGDYQSVTRLPLLRLAISKMVVAEVVTQYTLLDDILATLICNYFLGGHSRWHRQKKFTTFVHYILDEMYLLKKLEVVHAVKPVTSDVRKTVQKVNAIRNALAHSFFPENRKEFRSTRKVVYADKDLFTSDGLEAFQQDSNRAFGYFARRAFGIWHDDVVIPLAGEQK